MLQNMHSHIKRCLLCWFEGRKFRKIDNSIIILPEDRNHFNTIVSHLWDYFYDIVKTYDHQWLFFRWKNWKLWGFWWVALWYNMDEVYMEPAYMLHKEWSPIPWHMALDLFRSYFNPEKFRSATKLYSLSRRSIPKESRQNRPHELMRKDLSYLYLYYYEYARYIWIYKWNPPIDDMDRYVRAELDWVDEDMCSYIGKTRVYNYENIEHIINAAKDLYWENIKDIWWWTHKKIIYRLPSSPPWCDSHDEK